MVDVDEVIGSRQRKIGGTENDDDEEVNFERGGPDKKKSMKGRHCQHDHRRLKLKWQLTGRS